jgi:hypothetical protein
LGDEMVRTQIYLTEEECRALTANISQLGAICIRDSYESAQKFYRDTVAVLGREAQR